MWFGFRVAACTAPVVSIPTPTTLCRVNPSPCLLWPNGFCRATPEASPFQGANPSNRPGHCSLWWKYCVSIHPTQPLGIHRLSVQGCDNHAFGQRNPKLPGYSGGWPLCPGFACGKRSYRLRQPIHPSPKVISNNEFTKRIVHEKHEKKQSKEPCCGFSCFSCLSWTPFSYGSDFDGMFFLRNHLTKRHRMEEASGSPVMEVTLHRDGRMSFTGMKTLQTPMEPNA